MNKKLLSALVIGETLLMSIRATANGSFQAEFAEIIPNPTRNSALAGLNEGDDRFDVSKPKARRAYAKITAQAAMKQFGLDIAGLKEGEVMEDINILNPSLDGLRLRVQVSESHVASEWAQANLEKAAKNFTNAKTNEKKYFVRDGKFIFSNTTVTNAEPKHSIIESSTQLTYAEAQAAGVSFDVVSDVAVKSLNS